MIVKLIFVLICIGICIIAILKQDESALLFIKSIFNKILIILIIGFGIWSLLVLYLCYYMGIYRYCSFSVIVFLLIFDIFVFVINSYIISYDDNYIKKMFSRNFKIYSLFWLCLCLYPFILHFNLDKILSVIIPKFILLILEILFLPYMYIIALFNEYVEILNISNYDKKDVLKFIINCNFHLKKLFKLKIKFNVNDPNNNLNQYSNNKIEFIFQIKNKQIFLDNKKIGKYQLIKDIPNFNENYSLTKTKYNKIEYFLDYGNYLKKYDSVCYFECCGKIIKVILNNQKCVPLKIWSPLIEEFHEKNLNL